MEFLCKRVLVSSSSCRSGLVGLLGGAEIIWIGFWASSPSCATLRTGKPPNFSTPLRGLVDLLSAAGFAQVTFLRPACCLLCSSIWRLAALAASNRFFGVDVVMDVVEAVDVVMEGTSIWPSDCGGDFCWLVDCRGKSMFGLDCARPSSSWLVESGSASLDLPAEPLGPC